MVFLSPNEVLFLHKFCLGRAIVMIKSNWNYKLVILMITVGKQNILNQLLTKDSMDSVAVGKTSSVILLIPF